MTPPFFQCSLRRAPKYGGFYYHLVRLLLARSDFDAARQIAEDAMARTRRDPFSYCALAEVHLRTGDLSEARAICRRGLDVCSAIGQLYALAAEASEREGDLAGAMELCREWVKEVDRDGQGYVVLATRLLQRGEKSEATQIIHRGLDNVPGWPPLLELANLLEQNTALACLPRPSQ